MIQGFRVSVIVSVFNEEKTVGGVLTALVAGKKIDEVICIDDGSTDGTRREIDKFKMKVKVIHFAKNRGKGAAMAQGVRKAKGDIVVFFDSDLVGVKPGDVYKLVVPLVLGKARTVLGTCGVGSFISGMLFELSGQRAYWRKDVLPLLANFENSRLGVETYLNSVLKDWIFVKLGYYHLEKFEKQSKPEAAMAYIKEGIEIVKQKAINRGWWNEEWRIELEELSKIHNLVDWNKAIKKIKNYRLVRMLNKYRREYLAKLQNILGID
jgi:glycosyltransferase involved in cell wall biosynthesis